MNANNMTLIKDIFDSIDKNVAKKFMSNELTDLEKEYQTLNKDNIESKFSVFKQKLEVFSHKINRIIQSSDRYLNLKCYLCIYEV